MAMVGQLFSAVAPFHLLFILLFYYSYIY